MLQVFAEFIDDLRLLIHGGEQFLHLALHLMHVVQTILSNLIDQIVDFHCCKLPGVFHLCTNI